MTIKVLTTFGPADAPVSLSEIELFRKGDGSTPKRAADPEAAERPRRGPTSAGARPSGGADRHSRRPVDPEPFEHRGVLAAVAARRPGVAGAFRASIRIRHSESW